VTIVDGVRLVSNSEVQTYKDCPRRWWLAWYRGLTPRTADVTSPAATGNRIHAALAAYYVPDGEQAIGPLVTLLRLQDEDFAKFDATVDEWTEEDRTAVVRADGTITERRRAELLSTFDLENAMLSGYLGWIAETGVDAELEVVQSEAYVEARFDPPSGQPADEVFGSDVKLIGKIDARVRSRVTGRRKFIDHKTVGALYDPMLGLNQQMLHYQLIEFLNTNDADQRCDGALYNMLRKVKRTRASKPPYFARVPIDHNIHELKNYLYQIGGVIASIVETEEILAWNEAPHQAVVPPRPSRDCVWKCPFFKVCRMFDDGSRVEDAVEALYEKRDPLSYYGGRHLDHE
jgi:hypothetical protein